MAAQTYSRIEQIVVDGGSSDGTVARLGSAAGIRWLSEPDCGQAEAINKGFSLATGSIFTWLNADDTLVPAAVERAVATFARKPSLELVFGNCRIVENGQEVLTWRAPRHLTVAGIVSGCSIPQPGAFFTREAFERAGRLDGSFELAMDLDLWLRLLATGVESRRIPGVASVFELHSGSKTGSLPRREFYEESARAFALAGVLGGPELALGQGAAVSALREGRISREQLEVELRAVGAPVRSLPRLDVGKIRAAAFAEAGVIELRTSLVGLRYLAAPEVWREPRIRRRLAAAARRGAPRVLRRLVTHGPASPRRT